MGAIAIATPVQFRDPYSYCPLLRSQDLQSSFSKWLFLIRYSYCPLLGANRLFINNKSKGSLRG